LFLAVSANQDEPTFDPGSNAVSVDFDPNDLAIIASLGLNLQAVQVVFSNPASALTGLETVTLDSGLFEEDLSVFGVIGNGIAMSLDQCEEIEGCAPNITQEELDGFIVQLEGRIEEIGRRLASGAIDSEDGQRLLAGFRHELANFNTYKRQLQAFAEAEDDFGDDFGELDDFAEEFDEALPAAAEDVGDQAAEPDTTGIEAPQVAEPAAAPAVEPLEEAFEELADEFSEAEIPLDEFEDLDEDLEEEIPADPEDFDVAPDDDFQDLDEEFDEFEDDEFEELEEEFDDSLVLALTISATINQYRGAAGLATNGRVVWTGDIVLPSFARGY